MKKKKIIFHKITIIGLGLIGSSLARACKKWGLTSHIAVCTQTKMSLNKCMKFKIVDSVSIDPKTAVEGSDLVMLCTPISKFSKIVNLIHPHLKKGAIISDVGSVKQNILKGILAKIPKEFSFVPGHPIAGTEHSGPDHGFAELFMGRWCILTPPKNTSNHAVNKVAKLWRAVGMKIKIMDARHHDSILALTSHLPHLIAYTIVGTATGLQKDIKSEVFKFAAGGFRDFTRIAASDPVMWRDIFLENRHSILEILKRFNQDLTLIEKVIKKKDGEKLQKLLKKTRSIRLGVIAAKQA